MTVDTITGSKIQGVTAQAVSNAAIAPAIRWSADEVKARKLIKAAFETDGKFQWTIGDLLTRIAPDQGQGTNNPEATDKFREISEENDKAVRTLQEYRQVAGVFGKRGRPRFAFSIAQEFTRAFDEEAMTEAEKYADNGGKLTVKAVRDYLADTESARHPDKASHEAVTAMRDKLHKLYPEGGVLTEEDRQELLVTRLAIDNILNEGSDSE